MTFKPRRHWFRCSLRMLLVVMTAAAVITALLKACLASEAGILLVGMLFISAIMPTVIIGLLVLAVEWRDR
jgi:hypothetical protein